MQKWGSAQMEIRRIRLDSTYWRRVSQNKVQIEVFNVPRSDKKNE